MYFWDHKFENVRLNEKIYVSKLSRAFVLQCVFDLEKFNVLIFFSTNFSPPFMSLPVKIYMKRYDRNNKAHWTTNFLNSVLLFYFYVLF